MLFAALKSFRSNRRNLDDNGSDTMSYWQIANEYFRYYGEGIVTFWRNLRPATYSGVLIMVWVFGFVLLKSGARRF